MIIEAGCIPFMVASPDKQTGTKAAEEETTLHWDRRRHVKYVQHADSTSRPLHSMQPEGRRKIFKAKALFPIA